MDEVGESFIFSIISFLMIVQKIKVIEKQILVTLIPVWVFCHYTKDFPMKYWWTALLSDFWKVSFYYLGGFSDFISKYET